MVLVTAVLQAESDWRGRVRRARRHVQQLRAQLGESSQVVLLSCSGPLSCALSWPCFLFVLVCACSIAGGHDAQDCLRLLFSGKQSLSMYFVSGLLFTFALCCLSQPPTRYMMEDIGGMQVSSNISRSLSPSCTPQMTPVLLWLNADGRARSGPFGVVPLHRQTQGRIRVAAAGHDARPRPPLSGWILVQPASLLLPCFHSRGLCCFATGCVVLPPGDGSAVASARATAGPAGCRQTVPAERVSREVCSCDRRVCVGHRACFIRRRRNELCAAGRCAVAGCVA